MIPQSGNSLTSMRSQRRGLALPTRTAQDCWNISVSDLEPEAVVRAALRWVPLLRLVPAAEAFGLILANASFANMARTQYALGYEFLERAGILRGDGRIADEYRHLPDTELRAAILERTLVVAEPPWLSSADEIASAPDELPTDVLQMAEALGLTDGQAWVSTLHAFGKVDARRRVETGGLGELALVRFLETQPELAVDHVAARTDALGYDIAVGGPTGEWHIEVKSTVSLGRLVVFLSRNEYETARFDPAWRLVTVAIDRVGALLGVATVAGDSIVAAAPQDKVLWAKWDSMRMCPHPGSLSGGLPFLGLSGVDRSVSGRSRVGWLPD
jgi:hypothetical protein